MPLRPQRSVLVKDEVHAGLHPPPNLFDLADQNVFRLRPLGFDAGIGVEEYQKGVARFDLGVERGGVLFLPRAATARWSRERKVEQFDGEARGERLDVIQIVAEELKERGRNHASYRRTG